MWDTKRQTHRGTSWALCSRSRRQTARSGRWSICEHWTRGLSTWENPSFCRVKLWSSWDSRSAQFDHPPVGQASSTENTMLVPGGFGEAGAHGPPVSKLHRDAGGRMARRSPSPSPPSWTAAAPGWGKPAKIAVGSADQAQSGDAPGSSMVGQTPPRFSRMATQPDAVQAHPASVSAKPHRPVCDTNQRSTGAIRLLAFRAVSRRYRRFRARLAQSRRLSLSTFLASESRDQSSASTEGSNPGLSDSIMEGSNLVSSTVGGGCSSSGPLAAVARLTPRPAGPVSSTSGEATTGTSRVAYLRTTYASAQFSPAVSELLLASWREGSGKHYNSTWRLWNSWCEPRKINPSCPPLKEVLSFLATQFNEERAYRTVSGYRSALSSTLPPVDGVAVGAHPLVARLMKGAYNLRPPKPRYTSTWDVGEVLTVLQSIFWRRPIGAERPHSAVSTGVTSLPQRRPSKTRYCRQLS